MYIKIDATRQQSSLIFINFRLLLCIPDITCTSKNTQMRHIYDGLSVTSTSSTSVTQIKALLFQHRAPFRLFASLLALDLCASVPYAPYTHQGPAVLPDYLGHQEVWHKKSTRPESERVYLINGAVTWGLAFLEMLVTNQRASWQTRRDRKNVLIHLTD